ncbi:MULTISPECIES: hypothetical protein [Cyanophyceae]|uniref:hypothetical protein n=1 Tax=Cyanophyceae TaxID=3028117 RepID=UPI00168405DA|nr:hypothetical protein [Trichocoleus sp. FACHB-69]MBD1934603.1 hypothetical protein [Trichocoleus sp. FACHB-69]
MQDLDQNANLNQYSNSMTEVTSSAANKEIVFIDATVADKESLAAGVKPGTEVIILDCALTKCGINGKIMPTPRSIRHPSPLGGSCP